MADLQVGTCKIRSPRSWQPLGLLLVFVAVIGTVMGVTSFALGGNVFATVCCAIALVSFVGSIACFIADGKRFEAAEASLPFPSMLRN